MKLRGEQIKQLREALQRAYPSAPKLKMLLREELDERLDEVVGGSNLTETVAELVDWAEAEGKLVALVSAAFRRNPGNPRLREFVESFGIVPSQAKPAAILPYGPEFTWRGAKEELELQGFWRPKPELWDIAFLKNGVDQAASVCRVEVEGEGAIATGFLVKKDLLLTNYHVLDNGVKPDLAKFRLCFGRMTSVLGTATTGQIFRLAEHPIVRSSPTHELDYVLLRVDSAILETDGIRPVNFVPTSPTQGGSIHILQHPDGEEMKIVFGTNGITGVYEQQGLVQYISKTSTGSSGSPCFNDDWQLVALHHAQRATTFGVVCEGILFSAIYPQIADILP